MTGVRGRSIPREVECFASQRRFRLLSDRFVAVDVVDFLGQRDGDMPADGADERVEIRLEPAECEVESLLFRSDESVSARGVATASLSP